MNVRHVVDLICEIEKMRSLVLHNDPNQYAMRLDSWGRLSDLLLPLRRELMEFDIPLTKEDA